MAWCGGLALTTDRSMILATRIIQRGLDEQRPITEALLWQFRFDGFGEEFLTVGASPGWRPSKEVEDGLPDGRQAWLWRRSPDSFFSVPLL